MVLTADTKKKIKKPNRKKKSQEMIVWAAEWWTYEAGIIDEE